MLTFVVAEGFIYFIALMMGMGIEGEERTNEGLIYTTNLLFWGSLLAALQLRVVTFFWEWIVGKDDPYYRREEPRRWTSPSWKAKVLRSSEVEKEMGEPFLDGEKAP